MSCVLTINKWSINVSESFLIGLFCSMFDTYGTNKNDFPCDVEISLFKDTISLPNFECRSWSLFKKFELIRDYCDSLKFVKESRNNTVLINKSPTNSDKANKIIYYLPKVIDIIDFKKSYQSTIDILDDLIQNEKLTENCELLKNNWKPNQLVLDQAKLIQKPVNSVNPINKVNQIENKRNFKLNVPCYLWDLPQINCDYKEEDVSTLVNLFLRDCLKSDHDLLMDHDNYLRFMIYQDKPCSDRYVYAYIRKISDCTFESHKSSLRSVVLNTNLKNLVCEVSYAQRGYFFSFPMDQWKNKFVDEINIVD